MSSLYILDINSLSDMSFVNTLFHSVGCLFVLLIVSFTMQKLFSLMSSYLFLLSFPILHKAIYRFNAMHFKIPMTFHKRPWIAKAILKKNNVGDITLPGFKPYCKALIIKQYGTGRKTNRSMDQNKELRNKCKPLWPIDLWWMRQDYGVMTISLTSSIVETGQIYAKKLKLDHFLMQYTKINSK